MNELLRHPYYLLEGMQGGSTRCGQVGAVSGERPPWFRLNEFRYQKGLVFVSIWRAFSY
jgi:hypothetical protein